MRMALSSGTFTKGSRSLPRNETDRNGIGGERAIAIASADAISKGEKLTECEGSAFGEREFWHIVFTLKNKELTRRERLGL